MLTLRRYFNLAEAALAKTLLEDYEVFCSIWDENINISAGAYVAVPARLVVVDRQFERAARILNHAEKSPIPNDELAAATDQRSVEVLDEEIFGEPEQSELDELLPDNNPWEILAVAYLFLVPGLGLMFEKRTLLFVIKKWGRHRFLVLSPFETHLFGAALLGAAALLIVLYVYARRRIAREATAPMAPP